MECDNPYYVRFPIPKVLDSKPNSQPVYGFGAGCGKCIVCLKKRKQAWSFRLQEEQADSFSAAFVTLTYNDRFLPLGETGPTGNKDDHKHFIKWLKYYEADLRLNRRDLISEEELERRRLKIEEDKPLKYYGIIEYGDQFERPHLHYIIFNVKDWNNVKLAWSSQVKIKELGGYFPAESMGRIEVDECNPNTIDYVLKYITKHDPSDGDFEEKEKELSFMSKGLGSGFIDSASLRHIQQPYGNMVVNRRGIKTALPRYYNKKYLSESQRNKKSAYIRDEVEKKKEADYQSATRSGLPYDELQSKAKNARFTKQISRTKNRDLKQR